MQIPQGIPNIGNSCYVASIIQCLRRLDLNLANHMQFPNITLYPEDVVEYLDNLLDLNPQFKDLIELTLSSDNRQYKSNVIYADLTGKNIQKLITLNKCIIILRFPEPISINNINIINFKMKLSNISYAPQAFICYENGHYYSVVNWNDNLILYNDDRVIQLKDTSIKLPVVLIFYILL